MANWYDSSYSRLLIDNHITEDLPELMTRFDPAEYVRMVELGKIDAAMVYATCHNGNCYYPTKVGHMHKNLNGRDIFGQTVELLKQKNITPIAYYTWIYHNQSAKDHPEWRMVGPTGKQHDGRYWYSCPNHPEYMQFSKDQAAEVVAYDVKGIFVDMTFWPLECLCSNCRKRYQQETGKEIPTTIDWANPQWVSYQRAREKWMAGFAQELTDFIKSVRPDITVVHQFSPVLAGWHLGQSPGIAEASDYTSADFYGGKFQHRLGTKVMAAFSQNTPYEFMTSRCVNLYDHTSTKSEDELRCSAATTLANGGACFFIDAINPDGTLVEEFYQKLGRINQQLAPFQRKLAETNPVLHADTGLYFSMPSFVNENLNGYDLTSVNEVVTNMNPMVNIRNIHELIGTSIILNRMNRPYSIITENNTDLSNIKTLIINNASYMSPDETQRIRQFVAEGGTLIATGLTSYYDTQGNTTGDFALADVFGVSYTGKQTESVNFLAGWKSQQYVLCNQSSPLVNATAAETLAKVAECAFAPNNPDRYVSIHSNPPGETSEHPGLTVNNFGKGKCVYLYSSVMTMQQDAQQDFAVELLNEQTPAGIISQCNATDPVEVTLLKSTKDNSYLLCFVNYQQDLPNIPVMNLKATIALPNGFTPAAAIKISDNQTIPMTIDGNLLTIELPKLETIEMIQLA